MTPMRQLYDTLKQRFPLTDLCEQRDNLAFISVGQESLRPLIMHLRAHEGFTHLVLLTAVDWIEQQQFQLTYLLSDRLGNRDVGLRVLLQRDDASMETIHDIWPTAATYQRELREMFGINFPHSPGVDTPFILEGWNDIPPYRRDFDTLKYSQDHYNHRPGRESRDPAQHMQQQLYPDGAGK